MSIESKVTKIKEKILFEDLVLEQLETMEKLERLVVEMDNLVKQH